MVALAVDHLCVEYPHFALHDISFSLEPGEILSVVGPSGCGKTTLLRAISGVIESCGNLSIDGRSIASLPPEQRPTSMMFQQPVLFGAMSVRDNVAFGLDSTEMPLSRRDELVDLAMVTLGVERYADMVPQELSGGQTQRVALARALVRHPRVMLFDEPLSHVEPALTEDIRADILRQIRLRSMAAVYVTHDLDEAFLVGDLVAVMNEGTIVQLGAPEEVYRHPVSRFVAEFLGQENIVPCSVMGRENGEAKVVLGRVHYRVPVSRHAIEQEGLLVLPPEAIVLEEDDPRSTIMGSTGQVIAWAFLGQKARVEVETEIGTLVVYEWDPSTPRPRGQHVRFSVKPGRGWVIPS